MAKRQIEIPVYNNSIVTSRSLNGSHASNQHIQMSDETKYITELKNKLKEIKIRFDTAPHFYQREDYKELIDLLSSCLIHLYENVPQNFVINEWSEEPQRDLIPSERLVKLAIPTNVSELNNDSGYITTETDPTVPAWAKEVTKPSYTAEEVGALSSATIIPSKTSELINDSGFITGYTESDPTVPAWAKEPNKPTYTAQEVGALPSSTTIPSKTSDLTNDSGFITGYTETDPTVPSWAKQPNKPSYTAEEVGALSSDTIIPTKTSELTNDSGFITGYIETDPTVPSWAKESSKPTYTANEVGALPNDTFIPENTSDLINDSGFITSADILVIDKTQDTSSTFAIDPNKMYMFGTRTSLTITLNSGQSGIVNEYMFQFTSGNTATTLSVPSSIKWIKDPDIQANKKYLVSIENSLGIIGEWNNE